MNFHNPSFSFSIECRCVCPQTGQVCSSSLIIACILLCGVFGSVPLGRASLACLGCAFWLALACVFSCCFLLGDAGFFPFVVAVPWFWRCCCLLSCLFWRLGCLRCDLLFPVFPPSLPPWLSSGAFWSSQSCRSLPPDIWLYLRRSGCHTFGMACRGDWLVSSLRFMATKASALCGALPSPPCCGCCSCAPRCGAEVFALG